MRDTKGVFLGNFLVVYSFLQLKPILLLKEIMILSPSLIELLHLALYALLDLRLLLIKLAFQQFGAVLNQLISVHHIELTSMRHLNYAQTSLYLTLVVSSQSELLKHYLTRPSFFLPMTAKGKTRVLHPLFSALLLPLLEVRHWIRLSQVCGSSLGLTVLAKVLVTA